MQPAATWGGLSSAMLLAKKKAGNFSKKKIPVTKSWQSSMDDNDFQDWDNDEFTCNSEDINLFLSKLEQRSNLKVLRPKVVKSLVDSGNKLGLFNLFLPKAYVNKICVWTNQNLQSNGHTSVSLTQFNAYLGLELATSIVGLNRLKQYWSTKMFLGHKDFQRTMSLDTFLQIRTHLSLVCLNSSIASSAIFSASVLILSISNIPVIPVTLERDDKRPPVIPIELSIVFLSKISLFSPLSITLWKFEDLSSMELMLPKRVSCSAKSLRAWAWDFSAAALSFFFSDVRFLAVPISCILDFDTFRE